MHAAVSPYHLTSREPAALAALLLAERVLTILPTGGAAGEGVTRASVRRWLQDAPRYARLLESWRWSGALWRAGVIRSTWDARDAADEAEQARTLIAEDEAWAALRRFDHADLRDAEERLDAWCADLLKGGPDPGWCVPAVAGLDRFARAHGLIGVRSGGRGARGVTPPSLTQRAEGLLGQTRFSVGVPVLLAAGGGVILRAREMLEPELMPLREAMVEVLRGGEHAGAAGRAGSAGEGQARVRTAAARFGEAFEAVRRELVDRDDEQGTRVEAGMVRIEARVLPADAALRASVAALRAAQVSRGEAGARGGATPGPATRETLSVLTITPMDVRVSAGG